MQQEIIEEIYLLEQRLLKPEVRKDRVKLSRLIADEFIEYGSSGRIYTKEDVLEIVPGISFAPTRIEDFHTRLLSPQVVLASYTAVAVDGQGSVAKRSERSSIWRLIDGRWQIVFHQGAMRED